MSSEGKFGNPTTFVMSTALPVLGMEVVARDLLRELRKSACVEVVVGGGPTWVDEEFRQFSLGSDLRGWRRLLLVLRYWTWSRSERSGTIVVVGVWAAVPWLLIRSRRPCVIWEHSLSREKVSTSRGLKILARVAPLLYRRAWRIVCVSNALAEDVTHLTGRNDIEVIPNVVEIEPNRRCRPGPRAWPPLRLLCVGSLTNTKRQGVAIEALADLDESTELTIAGAGPTHDRLMKLAVELGVEERVRFVGQVDRSDVLDLMLESDVLVHPAAGETFGVVLIEAAQVSLPVLAVATRHSSEFVPRYAPGQLFDGTKEDLVRQLRRRELPATPYELESAAAVRADELSTASIASRWKDMLETAAQVYRY